MLSHKNGFDANCLQKMSVELGIADASWVTRTF